MARDLYCPHCGAYVGNCGHVPGGLTDPVTLSGTCGKCEREYSVTCKGDCLDKKGSEEQKCYVLNLRISEDGRAIVDDNGEEVARFREGLSVNCQKEEGVQKLPGHLVCKDECIAWDSNGKCVKHVRSCTWEFPPFDF